MQKMLDSPFLKVLMSGSVGASLPKSRALRRNPRGFSRSGGELQSDTGSRSRMDSTAQHYFEAARKADVQAEIDVGPGAIRSSSAPVDAELE